MENQRLFMELVSVAVCGKEPTEQLKGACTPEALEAVYSIGMKHDLAHLIGQAAEKLQLKEGQILQKSKNAAMQVLLRHTRQEYAFRTACGILEKGEIPFIPLKGSVLRQWYPEPWLRTSCDIDILVRENQLSQAKDLLEQEGWKSLGQTSHDINLLSPQGVHLELHFSTIEDYISPKSKAVMEHIWQWATPMPEKQYRMEIPDRLFYFYHMAHMAKHLLNGGCGIRSFLDVWVLNHCVAFDPAERTALLQKGDLTAFARASEKLSEIWFSGEEMDALSLSFQKVVLSGGIYGTVENRVSLQEGKAGGKLQLAMKRIFLPYDIMKYRFPVLQKHRWLLPVYQPVRWLQLLFGGGVKRSVTELKTTAQVSPETQASVRMLLEYLNL